MRQHAQPECVVFNSHSPYRFGANHSAAAKMKTLATIGLIKVSNFKGLEVTHGQAPAVFWDKRRAEEHGYRAPRQGACI